MSDAIDARDAWRDALVRAGAFVAARGTPLERLRARALLGEVPAARVREQVVGEGGLSGTAPERLLPAFEALDAVGQLSGRDVEHAVASATAALAGDGGFGPADAPEDARIVLTGMLGGFLTKTLMLRPRFASAVDGFLCRSWDEARVKGGDWEPIAAYAHWFSLNDSELSDAVLQWCGRELERGFRTGRFDALATSRVYVLCAAAALPGASLSVPELCEAVAKQQTGDGGWALSARALAGEPVAAALDGIAALVRIGRLGPAPQPGRPGGAA